MLVDVATQTALAARKGVVARHLLWVSARNRTTGVIEETGFWTGADDRSFSIAGQTRAYFGAGGLIAIAPITYEAGLDVRQQRLVLGPVTPEVEQLLRTYDPRLAPAVGHMALFDPDDGSLISLTRWFKGWIEAAPIKEAGFGTTSQTVCELTLAASSRAGTQGLPLKKSDSAQRLRGGDRGRRYADATSAAGGDWWGEEPA